MNTFYQLRRGCRKKAGQTLALFAIMCLSLLIVVGLCVDAGTVYLAKAELDKAVDAASLTIVRNLFQGQTVATTVGQAAFTANYHSEGLTTNSPALNITYATDSNSNTTVTLLATATVKPFFIGLVPRFSSFQVSSGATATRAKLIMSLVLDVSGSMSSNGGSTTMPSAAKSFIGYFDDTMDHIALITFSSTTNLSVRMSQPFKSAITTAINGLSFGGATYTDGGLKLALQQILTVPVSTNDNVIRVVVLFTDGYANTFQYTWLTNKTYNLGGYDPPPSSYAVLNPTNGVQLSDSKGYNSWPQSGSNYPTFFNSTNMYKFLSASGTNMTVNPVNCTAEGQLRALNTAASIRGSNMYVFCIGLGSSLDTTFLAQAANDPSASTFNANQPIGEYIVANTTSDLQTAFLEIASKILLRLTK
jgi:Flp pilus assembly protein TadG